MNFFWKLLYVFHMRRLTDAPVSMCLESADAWIEAYGTEEHPLEAVLDEISCWDSDE